MARGWESKAVADQLEQADVRPIERDSQHEVSPAVRVRRERLESLRLARSLTTTQMERPITRAHRDMLERKLKALETEIESLN